MLNKTPRTTIFHTNYQHRRRHRRNFSYRAVQPYEELFSVVQSSRVEERWDESLEVDPYRGHPPHYERSHGEHGTNYERSPYSNDDLLIKCFNSLTAACATMKNSRDHPPPPYSPKNSHKITQ